MDLARAKKEWDFLIDAYQGEGGFANGGYIDRYTRESDDKYKKRRDAAVYENRIATKINRYIGYIFKNTPNRVTSSDIIIKIFDDVDSKGNAIDIFMSDFATKAKVLGANLLLVDMPKEMPPTLQDQIEQRALPYFVQIEPQRVLKYKLDQNGKFEYVLFSDVLDRSTIEKDEIKSIKRYYDKVRWIIFDENDEILEMGEHNLGVNPLLFMSESGEFPAVGEFSQLAYLQKKLYNKQSELDEMLREQTFSILTIQADNPKDIEIRLSTDNAIGYGKDVDRPGFIAPPAAPAEIYQKEVENIKRAMDEIAYDISTSQAQESGIALTLKFQGLNASLSKFAQKLNDLENRAFDVACRYLGIQNDITITYPKTFDIIDTQKEIEVLGEMKSLIDSPTYFKLKAMQIISNDLNTIDQEDLAVIISEIEDGVK